MSYDTAIDFFFSTSSSNKRYCWRLHQTEICLIMNELLAVMCHCFHFSANGPFRANFAMERPIYHRRAVIQISHLLPFCNICLFKWQQICHLILLFTPYNVSVIPLGAASHPRQTVAGQSQSQPRLWNYEIIRHLESVTPAGQRKQPPSKIGPFPV